MPTPRKRHAQHAGRVTGREVLAEEFFGLFELLHRLQQDTQIADANHGTRVSVPQLEAPCELSLKEKQNHRLSESGLQRKLALVPSTLLLALHQTEFIAHSTLF